MNPRLLLPALAALAIAVAACDGDADDSATPRPSPAATASVTPSASPTDASPTETTSPTPPVALEAGRHFGYIEALDPTVPEIEFDLAYLLTGDEANEAAEERGEEVPVPNDYYIVNDNPRLRTLPLAPNVKVFVLEAFGPDVVRGDFDAFVEGFETNEFEGQYHGSAGSYRIVVRDGVVVRIEEQYFP